MNSMKKKRIHVVPLNDLVQDQAAEDRSVTSKSSRSRSSRTSRIRLRRSSSKNSINSNKNNNDNNNNSKSKRQQQQQQLFSKRPYLYKSAGEHSPTKQTRLHFNNLINSDKNNNNKNNKNKNSNIINHETNTNPVHWIDWIDSGMDLFGCGIAATANANANNNANANANANNNTDNEVLSSSSTADTADKSNSTTNSNTNNNNNTNTNTQNQPNNYPRHHKPQQIKDHNKDIATIQKRHKELMKFNYVQLHEDFFDSLLKEEGDQMLASLLAAAAAIEEKENGIGVGGRSGSSSFSVTSASGTGTDPASASAAMSTTSKSSAISTTDETTTVNSIKSGNNKSPSVSSTRTVRMNRCLGSFGKKKRQRRGSTTSSIEEYNQLYNPDLLTNNEDNNNNASSTASKSSVPVTSVLCIQDIMAKDHLETPGHYVHPACRLQKDKGRGERLESSISATGRESCLVKLRDKMKLIVEVSGELHANSSSSFNNNNNDLASVASVTSSSSTSNNKNSTIEKDHNKAMSAGMKRRRAKIASIEKNSNYCEGGRDDGSCFIETRSMIELQLGFLSMQYGLLLRWDAYRTGQIVYVCLRKMCHDSFYTKIPSIPITTTTTTTKTKMGTTMTTNNNNNSQSSSSSQQQRIKLKQQYPVPSRSGFDDKSNGIPRIIAATKKREGSSPLVVRSRKGGNHAIYQKSSGATEVILVDAPYHVPQPDVFAPSVLTLDIHQLTGLDPKSRWTLSMTFNGHTEMAHLTYNQQERVFETTRTTPCRWEMIMATNRPVTSFDIATGLEIRLFEQRPKQGFRGVVSVGGIVGRSSFSSSSSSSLVPPGRDSFSLNSPSSSYVIQNQRLIHYNVNKNGRFSNSESSLGSSNSGGGGGSISNRNSSKKSTSRLASTMTVPLGGLVSQPSASQTALWKLTIPFTHNQNSMVNLTLKYQSDYSHWLYRELRARRKEELALSSSATGSYSLAGGESGSGNDLWRRFISPRNSNSYDDDLDDLDDTDLYCMDWIYCC
jgi:hypothetical protein